MNIKIFTAVLLLFLMSMAAPVTVISECEPGESRKSETAVFDNDYLFMGKSLEFSGASEDLIFLGESLNFTGKTSLGVVATGETLQLSGSVGNGIIAGAGNIFIDGNITGTSFLGAQKVVVGADAVINGDIFAGCGEIEINAPVEGNIYIGSGKVTINSEINGNVTAYCGRLIISESARINGDLTYSTEEKLTESELARVRGTVLYEDNKDIEDIYNFTNGIGGAIEWLFKVLFMISFIIAGILILFLPLFRRLERERSTQEFWKTALWGLIPIFMYPAIILLFVLMGVTIPLAVALLFAVFPLFLIANVIGAVLFGQFLSDRFNWSVTKRHYHFLIGAFFYLLLSIIPIVDFFAFLLLSSLGWGVYISVFFDKRLGESKKSLLN